MREGSPHLRRDEEQIQNSAQRSKTYFIFDLVKKASSRKSVAGFRCELVPVMPTSERALTLNVLEELIHGEADDLRFGSNAEWQEGQCAIGGHKTRARSRRILGR